MSYKDRSAVQPKWLMIQSDLHSDVQLTQVENTQRFINEAFDMSTGTQRSDMGFSDRAFMRQLINKFLTASSKKETLG